MLKKLLVAFGKTCVFFVGLMVFIALICGFAAGSIWLCSYLFGLKIGVFAGMALFAFFYILAMTIMDEFS